MNAPRLFCLYCPANFEAVYVSQSYSNVRRMLLALDPPLRKLYCIVRYDPWDDDACHRWVEVSKNNNNTKKGGSR